MRRKPTGQLAGRGREAAAVEGPSHQHDAHLLRGALEHLHVAVLHGLLVALLGHHEGLVRGLHLDEGVARGTALGGREGGREVVFMPLDRLPSKPTTQKLLGSKPQNQLKALKRFKLSNIWIKYLAFG